MTAVPLEATADICKSVAPFVYGGRVDMGTYIRPGAWRGTVWPCAGRQVLTDSDREVIGHVTCTCQCHRDGEQHELPARANRTAVHPTDVRNPCATT